MEVGDIQYTYMPMRVRDQETRMTAIWASMVRREYNVWERPRAR